MPKTLEQYRCHTYRATINIVALFVFSSIHPVIGLLFALFYTLVASFYFWQRPTLVGNASRFAIVALVSISQLLGFIVVVAMVYTMLSIASNPKTLRQSYARYLERSANEQ